MNKDINERIKKVMDDLGYPEKAFARRLGVSHDVMKRIISLETNPTMATLNKIVRTFPVNREWLWLNEGKPYSKSLDKYSYEHNKDLNVAAQYGDEEKANRFKYIRSALGLSQKEMADELGTTRDVLAQIETGRNSVQSYISEGLHTKFGVNLNWLLAGSGKAFSNEEGIRNAKKRKLLEELKKLEG